MSCHSTPGNRAVLSIARHYAEALTGKPVAEATVQRAFHALTAEGRRLQFSTPDRADIIRWFDQQAFIASLEVPAGRARQTVFRNLTLAREEFDTNPASITGATFHAWRFTADLTAYTASRRTNPDPVVVAFDCDGVLYNFNDTLREWLAARGWKREEMPDPEVYWLPDTWNITNDELNREIDLAVRAGVLWHSGAPLSDGTSIARQIGQAGHQIVVNTARALPGNELEAERATITWLRASGIHPDVLHLADPHDATDKLNVPFDVLFDDHMANVEAARLAGRTAFLIQRGWNDHVAEALPFSHVPRIVDGMSAPIIAP